MIFWDRNEKFKFRLSPKEIEEYVEEHSLNETVDTVGLHTTISLILNIIAAIATYFIFGFNIIAFAIAFVITDIVLVNIGWFGFHLFPYIETKRLGVVGAQKRINKLKKQREILFKKEENCMDFNERRALINKIENIEEYISIEQKFIDKENTKSTKQKIKKDNKINKDFDDKIEYFEDYKTKLKFYIEEKGITELKPVRISVIKLTKTLQGRPIGVSMIPETIYIYLDELQTIAEKLTGLSENYTEKYSENIKRVSLLLQENITELIEKIDRCETNDIEIGLNVLLQELENSNNKKIEDISDTEKMKVVIKETSKKKKGDKKNV